jgi:flavin-dependent dehydrogenase
MAPSGTDFDVVIAGAGPAGAAAAIMLQIVAPELSLCLVDGSPPSVLRVGETVPPPIRLFLAQLGLWDRFRQAGHAASYRTVAAWGGPELASNEFLLSAHQCGWRLDRAGFDRMLAEAAEEGGTRRLRANVRRLAHEAGSWRIDCGADAEILTARFVLDATGRAAALSRMLGARPAGRDGLIGCYVHFEGGREADQGTMIEAFSDGWWYSAALPGGRRVIACMTDADVLRRRGLRGTEAWMQSLGETRFVAAAACDATPLAAPSLRPAGSRCLTETAALPLLAVGDAASCFDPISSQGIVKALRSGIFAAYAVADRLCRGDDRGLARYRALIPREFAAYRRALRHYYAVERRWSGRPFWRRRQEPDLGFSAEV